MPVASVASALARTRRSSAAIVGVVGLLVSLAVLAGCGDNTTSDTKNFLINNQQGDPPLLRIVRVMNGGPFDTLITAGDPSDPVAQGTITIAANVKDTDTGGEMDILAEFSTDGGLTWRVATGFLNPSPPAVFASGATTYLHDPTTSSDPVFPSVNDIDFVWNAVADLGVGTQIPRLHFRMTPEDRENDGQGISDTIIFALDNRPSVFAPEALNVSTPVILPSIVVPGSNIVFSYDLKDTDSPPNLVSITPAFSIDGGAFITATEAPSPPATSQGTVGLSASAGGVTHVFVWDSATDFLAEGVLCSENVVFQVTPHDIGTVLAESAGTMLVGVPGESGVFTVANFPSSPNRGVAEVPTPVGVQSGCIQIGYSISDLDSSLSAVVIEFSTDGGLTFTVATENAEDGDSEGFCGGSGITTSPVGIGHIFSWNTIADGLAGFFVDVRVRVTPFDGLFGVAGTSGSFAINNPAIASMSAPGIVVLTPTPAVGSTTLGGAINIGYLAFDFDSDPLDIIGDVEWSTDGGATFNDATFRQTAVHSGDVGLDTSPCGTPNTYVWDSLCDQVGLFAPQSVIFRLAGTDIHGTGAFATTNPFTVENTSLPSILATNVTPVGAAPFADNIIITYELTATAAMRCAEIIPEYSINGGITFVLATEVVGPPSEGLSGIVVDTTATPHTFVWNSFADGVAIGSSNPGVVFRIRPVLVGVQGSSDTSAPFTVAN